jgi:hypothetical protein|tara:strand:+ start:261 stop:752 length:492 start_codon:yes stop_codon:yes gene_type:complete
MALPHSNNCSRKPSCKEIYLNKAGLDHIEIALLKIIRFFLQTYALEASHSWILALKASEKYFGKEKGARIGVQLMFALQEMRFARKSTFSFNAPQCNGCSLFLTEHERRLTSTISALRSGRSGLAEAEMMMLCEGHGTSAALSAFVELILILPEAKQPLPLDV